MYRCSTVPPVYFVCSSSCRVERLERIVGEADRAAASCWCSTGSPAVPACEDVGPALAVLLGEAVRGALGGRRLEVVHVAGLFLERDDARAHVVEQPHRERVARGRRDVVGVAREVADHLVDAVDADGREVVAQRAEVALGVREEPLVDQPLDHLALDLEAVARVAQQLVQPRVEAGLVAGGAGSPGARS